MDKLEEYFKLNREAFDDQDVPEGHLDRFEERLETLRYAQGDRMVTQAEIIRSGRQGGEPEGPEQDAAGVACFHSFCRGRDRSSNIHK